MTLQLFQNFMISEDFKNFHDYFQYSRNNRYIFTMNKFQTLLEYFKHFSKKKVLKKDTKELLKIFNLYDIPVIPKVVWKFQTSILSNNIEIQNYIKPPQLEYNYISDDETDIIENTNNYSINISKNIGVPYMFKISNKPVIYNETEPEYENDFVNEYYSVETPLENSNSNSESEEL